MSGWDKYAICTGCGEKYRAPFGSLFHIHFEVCPNCGTPKEIRGQLFSGWPVRTMRYVSEARLFHPSTWSAGHWEERDGDEIKLVG